MRRVWTRASGFLAVKLLVESRVELLCIERRVVENVEIVEIVERMSDCQHVDRRLADGQIGAC